MKYKISSIGDIKRFITERDKQYKFHGYKVVSLPNIGNISFEDCPGTIEKIDNIDQQLNILKHMPGDSGTLVFMNIKHNDQWFMEHVPVAKRAGAFSLYGSTIIETSVKL